MPGTLQVTLRERTFHFKWCNRTEVDYVCLTCGTIAVEGVCQYCERAREKKRERLARFLESKKMQEGGS